MHAVTAFTPSFVIVADMAATLLRRWLYGAAPTIVLFALMFLGHVFDDIEWQAFSWLAVTLFPMPVWLFVLLSRHDLADKLVLVATSRLLIVAASLYLLAVLLALGSTKLWIQSENAPGVDAYLWRTAAFLWPWNGLLLVVVYLLSGQRNTGIRRLQSKTVAKLLEQKVATAGSLRNAPQQHAFQLLRDNDVPAVFALLEPAMQGLTEQNDLVVLESEYRRTLQALHLQTEDPAAGNRTINRVVLSLTEMIERHL